VVHQDNYTVHSSRASTYRLEEKGIRYMPHQSYSSDLAIGDFCLFSTVKENFGQIQVADKDQFFEYLQDILSVIDQQELNGVFQAWVQRVQEASQGNGDYAR
jgi:hypothetical protein